MKNATIVISMVLFTALAGCAEKNVVYSGFLRDYSQLKPDPEVGGALRYLNPRKSLKEYNRFQIDPIAVQFSRGATGAAIDPAKLNNLTVYFRNELVKALTKNYRVVNRPGPRVLRIRAAITDVDESEPLLNIHPAMKLSGMGLGGASMEAEAVDSVTGERIGAIKETRSGNRMSITAGLSRLGHAKQVIRYWVSRFMKNLDKAHGVDGKG